VALLAFPGCKAPRETPATDLQRTGGHSGGGGSGGGAGKSGSAGAGPVDGPSGDEGGTRADEGCGPGTHVCAGKCLADDSIESCGSSCQPCPSITGGTPTCDGKRCGVKCPDGQKPCDDRCIGETEICPRTCQPGFHDCGGVCVDNAKVTSCGIACDSCPAAPAGGYATCDGSKCDFACDVGKRCNEKCGECCSDQDCTAGPGKVASCELATLKCKVSCPAGSKECGSDCIAEAACCKDADCPAMAGKVGQCDDSTHACAYTCAGDQKPCGGKCIASDACCDDRSCAGNFACVNNACSGGSCRSGFKLCGGSCIASSGCCEDRDCGGDFACVGHVCSKTMCRSGFKSCNGRCIPVDGCCNDGTACGNGGVCKGGQCLACDPARKPTCDGNAVKACASDGSRYTSTNCPRGCAGGACCGGNTETSGTSCVACGGVGQACCKTASPACGSGLSCDGGKCLYQCSNCDPNPHCEGNDVVTGKCNQTTGMCATTTTTACTGGRTCQGNQCVCPAGRVFVGGKCIYQCSGCNTANHCAGSNVVRETCNENTGRCDSTTVDSCTDTGEVCQGASCTCGNGYHSCPGQTGCKPDTTCCSSSDNYCNGPGCQSNVICDASRWPDVGIYAETRAYCGWIGNGGKQTAQGPHYTYFWQVGNCDKFYQAWAAEMCRYPAQADPGARPEIYIDAHTFANGGGPVWSRAWTCRCGPSGNVEECVKGTGFPGGP
jgi:hypothetical protein